ncbi:MAG: DNA polymerase Y family protein [Vicinamibacterales bacterium]
MPRSTPPGTRPADAALYAALVAAEGSDPAVLLDVARMGSPRIVVDGPRAVTLDATGLTRLFGDARAIAHEMRRLAAERGLRVRVAVASTRTAARLLAHARPGISVAEGEEVWRAVGALPIDLLPVALVSGDPDVLTLKRWGLHTLGDFARLPADGVAARLGQEGVTWQRLARGEDLTPLVPSVPEERFEQAMDLEWPIEGLEPLSFVLARLIDPLSAHLERRGRGAAVLHVRLHLVTREVYERSLQLPTPIRDARTLRTLVQLDLESHPPSAGIDRVVVAVDPTPGRVLQHSLLTRPIPAPEQLSTLMARLGALMGEDRCGSPVLADSWHPDACTLQPFAPRELAHEKASPLATVNADQPDDWQQGAEPQVACAVRRFRRPVPARVRVEDGEPRLVQVDRRGLSGGRVERCAGPWRTSGGWWHERPATATPVSSGSPSAWDRDEWDVTFADGTTCLLFQDRVAQAWFLDGVLD